MGQDAALSELQLWSSCGLHVSGLGNLRRVEARDAAATTADLHPVGPALYALPRRDDCAACKKDLGCTLGASGLGRGGPTLLPSFVAALLSLELGAAPSPRRPCRHPSLHSPWRLGLRRAENDLVVGPRMVCCRACDVPVVGRLYVSVSVVCMSCWSV